MLYAVKPCHVPWRFGLAKLMEANGLDLLVQKKFWNGFFRSEQRKLVSC